MIPLDNSTRNHLRRIQSSNRDKRMYVKVTTILMLDQGFSPATIADVLGIDASTVYRHQKEFKEVGMPDFVMTAFKGYAGRLTSDEQQILIEELSQNLHITSQSIANFIEHRFDKRYTQNGVVKLLKRLGFVYKKTRTVPSKANPEAQIEFIQALYERMQNLKFNEVIYFVDAMHLRHNTRADYGWIQKGHDVEIPSNSARDRLNLNGALNASNVTDIVIREDETINAQSTIKLWEAQRRRHPGKTIYNICDNARYYRSRIIKAWLEKNPWCQVIYLPAYSPNLNLIERLWKYLRKHVVSYRYYEHFADFRQAVLTFFERIWIHAPRLRTFLKPNFHIHGV